MAPTPPSSSSPSSGSDMTKDRFSKSTKAIISHASNYRCVCCLRELGNAGQCAHILDSAERGATILAWAKELGLLPAHFERSSSANGLKMCSSCQLDIFTGDSAIFSPPRQLLEYLIECVESGSGIPIHEVLHSQLEAPDLPDSSDVEPYFDLCVIIPLKPTYLEDVEFLTFSDPGLSQLLDGEWTVISDDTTTSETTGRIYDAASILHGARDHINRVDLSSPPTENELLVLTNRNCPHPCIFSAQNNIFAILRHHRNWIGKEAWLTIDTRKSPV